MALSIKILIFSRDNVYVNEIVNSLRKYSYEIIVCSQPDTAFDMLKKNTPFLIVTDDKFKDELNNEFLIELRKTTDIPVVVVSESDNIEYKLLYYSVGIDEFINKKWDFREAAARINAVLKRTAKVKNSAVDEVLHNDIYINISSYEIIVAGEKYRIPPKETELLYFLASNPGRVFTREQLLDRVWGYDYFGDSRTVDVHVKKLRKRFESKTQAWKIETVWGVGYKFNVS
ncbi:MAG: response regulator transcription factor [Clostridia bacterium]|nr:response regulator transcription factor [Clostridia bacterium]